jgi:hypothetical protein
MNLDCKKYCTPFDPLLKLSPFRESFSFLMVPTFQFDTLNPKNKETQSKKLIL